jgi:hypothetical protein
MKAGASAHLARAKKESRRMLKQSGGEVLCGNNETISPQYDGKEARLHIIRVPT